MKLTTSSLAMAGLLIISLLPTQNILAAGVNAGATTNDGAGTTTNNGNPATTNGATSPPTTTNPAPVGNLKNKQLNQPANHRDMNQPANNGSTRNNTNTVAPPPPANNCYTVDGQPSTTTDCSPGTNPNVR
ncbi:hypothetical protein SAMN05192566_0902 [Methylophilus rhizosphaerae]|uniref:Secreted protein n=1 Tax=Methylophilus rhizosphaerae TaxID=492660 RepID=A0A1G9AZ93_9PROT|nr:hypothetical protein [Methylophilus rhizosphaerae]SDK32649.1 hypothetical protein SAMN05192566_0902 [Methylophilus rhizosphaerae]